MPVLDPDPDDQGNLNPLRRADIYINDVIGETTFKLVWRGRWVIDFIRLGISVDRGSGVWTVKNIMKAAIFAVLAVFISLPMMAQSRGGDSGQRGTPGGAPSAPSTPRVSVVSPAPTVSSSSTSSRDYSGLRSLNSGINSPGHVGGYSVSNLQYTSFNSVYSMYQWQDFFYFLQMHYFMNPSYFSRFYRQREPLLTPVLARLTTQQPLNQSSQLLRAVDELETMLKEGEAGKSVDRAAVAAKTQEIRDLAKKIRSDESLAFLDQRRDKDALKLDNAETLGLGAIAQLREVATDLNTQLKNMYNQKTSTTVSVQNLAAPSFNSLTKGIDKLTKVIDSSARRM